MFRDEVLQCGLVQRVIVSLFTLDPSCIKAGETLRCVLLRGTEGALELMQLLAAEKGNVQGFFLPFPLTQHKLVSTLVSTCVQRTTFVPFCRKLLCKQKDAKTSMSKGLRQVKLKPHELRVRRGLPPS